MDTYIKSTDIYTDGSCNPKLQTGAWAAILFIDGQKIVLKGTAPEISHNRMELQAVIKALEYLIAKNRTKETIRVFSDSQYVVNLPFRKEKIKANNFLNRKGISVKNVDMIKVLFEYMEIYPIRFKKVKAHLKEGKEINFNREADKLARKALRESCEKDRI